jgi:ABC-type dipeptide/oligopeptide/nickel transport system permease subunit
MTEQHREPPLMSAISLGAQAPLPGLADPEAPAEAAFEAGLELKARSQWWYVRRRFLRHRLAMASFVVLLIVFGAGTLASVLAPYRPDTITIYNDVKPTLSHNLWFGTDYIGHDYLSSVLYGIRTSMEISLLVALISTVIGVVMGAVAGYMGSWIDNILMRVTDLFLIIPALAILLVAARYLGHASPFRLALILGLLYWVLIVRIVRGSFLAVKEKEYVEAARASGAGPFRIMFRHILPNTIGPVVVAATLVTGTAILAESTISFLGLGIQFPDVSLGSLVSNGEQNGLGDWWLVTIPGLFIVLIVLCINFLGDGLRDALDPTQRRIRA